MLKTPVQPMTRSSDVRPGASTATWIRCEKPLTELTDTGQILLQQRVAAAARDVALVVLP
jgi:hypothetical protein